MLNYFHPQGLHCPHCDASVEAARYFRTTKTSRIKVYHCPVCQGVYNLYSGTVFAQKQYRPSQIVLLGQGVCQGFSSVRLAHELGISRQAVHSIRHFLQTSAQMMQSEDVLPDTETETDEMFQNAGEKGEPLDILPPLKRGGFFALILAASAAAKRLFLLPSLVPQIEGLLGLHKRFLSRSALPRHF